MAITSSAKKAIRSSARKQVFNLRRKSVTESTLKKVRKLVQQGDVAGAHKLLPEAYRAIDKAAKTKFIKKNAASRMKSRITVLVEKAGKK